MKLLSDLGWHTREVGKLSLTLAALFLAYSPLAQAGSAGAGGPGINVSPATAEAARLSPLVNTTVGAARVLVPDGSSVFQSIGSLETRWFAFEVEPGKMYVVEAHDPYEDLGANSVGTISITDGGGVNPPQDVHVDCSNAVRDISPGLNVSDDGRRCTIYVNAADSTNLNRRGVFIGVADGAGTEFQIRVRESTIYGRWTTNGYDFHVELQNTTENVVCAQIILYGDAGYSFSGGVWTGSLAFYNVTIPGYGANKIVIPNGTSVGADKRGTMRIWGCPGTGDNFVPGSLNVSSYGFNSTIDKYLYFFVNTVNNGSANNSW